MKRRSIITKLLLILTISILGGALVTNIIVSKRVTAALDEELHDESLLILQSLDWAIRPLMEANEDEKLQRLIDNIAAYPIVESLRLYDNNENILFSNNRQEMGQLIHNSCVEDIIVNKSIVKFYEDIDKGIFEAALPVKGSAYSNEKGTDIQAIVYLKVDMDYVLSNWERLNSDFHTIYILISMILILVVGVYIYFGVGKPLLKFKEASEAISNQNYDFKLEGKMSGEFIELGTAFSKMQKSIKDYVYAIDEAKQISENALESKMVFITNMSHEIRTPLNSIIGFAQLLAEEEEDREKKKLLDIVHHSGQHLLGVINDLLDFSKLDSEQMKVESIEFNIRKLIKETSDFFALQLEKKGLYYECHIDKEVPTYVESDLNKVRQIFINLINNAIKFTHHGGIKVSVMYHEKILTIKISDTGIGIPKEKQEMIFDAFAQTDSSVARRYGGSGLGLSISQKFAHMLGGHIELMSEVGKGSDFIVTIEVHPVERDEIDGKQLLEAWMSADLELSDLVYETVISLDERLKKLGKDLDMHHLANIQSEVHALKGLTGNFQMMELYELFNQLDHHIAGKENIHEEDWSLYCQYFQYINNIHSEVYRAALDIKTFEDSEKEKDVVNINEKRTKILVAEDIRENRILIEKMLSKLPVDIIFATDGIEVMAVLRNMRVEALLLDIQMPNMSGEDVLLAFKDKPKAYKVHYKPYVIVLTAHATVEERDRCLAIGADDYLTKPIQKELLIEKVKKVIEKSELH